MKTDSRISRAEKEHFVDNLAIMTLVITALVCLSSGWFLYQEAQQAIHGKPGQPALQPMTASATPWNALDAGGTPPPAAGVPTNSLLPLAAPRNVATNSNGASDQPLLVSGLEKPAR